MRPEKRDERRERILEVAKSAFASEGFEETPMAVIAGIAGMAAGTLYNYFPSKESLLVAVFEREITELVSRGRKPRGVGEWASSALRSYARFPRERWREFMAAFYRGSGEEGLKSYLTQAPLLDSLQDAIEAELGGKVAESERLRRVLFSTFYQGFLRWLNSGRGLDEVTREVAGDLEAVVGAWRAKTACASRGGS